MKDNKTLVYEYLKCTICYRKAIFNNFGMNSLRSCRRVVHDRINPKDETRVTPGFFYVSSRGFLSILSKPSSRNASNMISVHPKAFSQR